MPFAAKNFNLNNQDKRSLHKHHLGTPVYLKPCRPSPRVRQRVAGVVPPGLPVSPTKAKRAMSPQTTRVIAKPRPKLSI